MVNHGCWHFDNGATSKIDDVLTEHDFSVSPGLIWVLKLVRLGWGWAWRVWGQGLTIMEAHLKGNSPDDFNILFEKMSID